MRCVIVRPYSPRQLLDRNVRTTAAVLVRTPILSIGSHIQAKECNKHCRAVVEGSVPPLYIYSQNAERTGDASA